MLASLAIYENNIAPDDWIENLLPNSIKLKNSLFKKIRVTDLASHQSGLPTLTDDHYLESLLQANSEQPFDAVDTRYIQQVLTETDYLIDYGVYHYSNFAYALLGMIVEECSGMKYENALATKLTKPLLMTQTGLNNRMINNRAGCFNQQGDVVEQLLTNKLAPAGGLCSTATDLITDVTQVGRSDVRLTPWPPTPLDARNEKERGN